MMNITSTAVDNINRKTYEGRQAKRQYSRATGWLDNGEKEAVNYALNKISKKKILDIGVGGGRTIPLLSKSPENYLGIDYTKSLIDVARKKYSSHMLMTMDARNLQLESEKFSLVMFSNNGIDSVTFDDREVILREIHRVLEIGGLFVFSSLNHSSTAVDIPIYNTKKDYLISLTKKFISKPIKVYNKRKIQSLVTNDVDTSARCLDAHFNGLIATFTSVSSQVNQLENNDFLVKSIFTTDGKRINVDTKAEESSYIHYVAEKI